MSKRGEGIYLRGQTWWLDCVIRGKRHYRCLGKNITRSVAKELAQTKRADILREEDGIGGRKRKDITFDKAAELFTEWAEANKRPRTVKSYRECLTRLGERFSGKRLSQIPTFHVEKYKQERSKGGAVVRANRELAVLKALFNRCKGWKKFEGENPVQGVKFLRESKGEIRFLDHEEEERLLAVCSEPLRTVVLVGIHTGTRIASEALTLRWGNIDLARRQLTVEGAYAKNGETRSIPVNSELHAALFKLREASANTGSEDPVFVNRLGEPLRAIRTAFTTACRRAGLGRDVTPHTLRHTFASRLVMAGVDLRTVQELGGWKELGMVLRYAHLSSSHKADAVERIIEKKPEPISRRFSRQG